MYTQELILYCCVGVVGPLVVDPSSLCGESLPNVGIANDPGELRCPLADFHIVNPVWLLIPRKVWALDGSR